MADPSTDSLPNNNRVPLIAISVIFTFLGTLIVFARLWVRGITTKSFGKDDGVIFAAWIASIGFTIASSLGLRYGVGLHGVKGHMLSEVPNALEATYYVEIFYYLSIFLIKVSILLFYLRLVDGLWGKFYTSTLLCLGLVTLHFISTLVVVFLQCRPISFYWNHDQPGSCINITSFFYSTNGFTIASDLIILGLPIPTLSKVRRSRVEKLALLSVFGAGAISTLASCVRLYTISIYTTSKDPLYDAAPINLWSFIEINLGIACASGPALKAVFVKIKGSVLEASNSRGSNQARRGLCPNESQVEFGLQFQQPAPRKPSVNPSVYEFDTSTGHSKATSTVSGASNRKQWDDIYPPMPSHSREIMVHQSFETRSKSVNNDLLQPS